MPTPLGQPALKAMLAPAGNVLVVNATRPEHRAEIVSAVVVRHIPDGPVAQSEHALSLSPDESVWLHPSAPTGQAPSLVEVLMRIACQGRLVEVYLASPAPSPPPMRGWETGIRAAQSALRAGEAEIVGASGIVAFLVPYE